MGKQKQKGIKALSDSLQLDSPPLQVDLVQHLKKLAKKDPTTKLKALTTLSTLLTTTSVKDVSHIIIPLWAIQYKMLLQDFNTEVRRATHHTMSCLVNAVGRDLAPHLKSLMGPWWFSQFDALHQVSQAAKKSLQSAFPTQDRILDALIFCTDEVFMYLGDNLNLTPQTMSDKGVAALDEQVISSSLLALAKLLDILTTEKHASSKPKHALKARFTAISHAEKLLSNHKCFLAFLTSHSSAIRSAAYSLVTSCVENIPYALNEPNIKTLAPAILGAFQETDPTCHCSMWEAVLLFSRKSPQSWSTLNIHDTLLNPFWNFLRNGCFGSQQVSYPALVLFLDCVPPKAIAIDRFFLDFFQNLWAGEVHSQSSEDDQLAFFSSYRDCFLWAQDNAQRYCDGVEAIHNFRRTIVDEVLLKLMWHDYLLVPSSEENMKNLDNEYQVGHVQEFGRCIIDILSGLFSLEPDLLSDICQKFEEFCLEAFHQSNDVENCEKIIRFLLFVDLHVVQKGVTWPLSYLVGPMLSKSFQLIQNSDSSNAVRFMVVAVSIFGPRKFVQEVVQERNEPNCRSDRDLSLKQFLQLFKDIFVPWCLKTDGPSTLDRLDLLVALLDDDCFSDQWDDVILHATSVKNTFILALLVEKTREKTLTRTGTGNSNRWHHELLDSTALSIACSLPPFGTSDSRFIRTALGGITEEDQSYFVSENTSILIFKEILQKLQMFIRASNFTWVRGANVLLNAEEHVTIKGCESSLISVLEMANFAVEVLNGSFFRLKTLSKSPGLLPSLLAALFLIGWEHSTLAFFVDDEAHEKVTDRVVFCNSVHAFRCELSEFVKTLSLDCRRSLGSTLVEAIRCVVLKEDNLEIDQITSLGCLYVLDVLDSLCDGQVEEQTLLDQLLNEGDSWPLWVMPDIRDGQRSATLRFDIISDVSESNRMAAFVDRLVSKLGIVRVIAGISSSSEMMTCFSRYPRAWLAAEMLCIWKWQGGSTLTSFLPSLFKHTRNEDPDNLFDAIVKILLDGALVQGENNGTVYPNIYPAPHDEAESIEQVFLRPLVSILGTLFENNIWERDKALGIFNLLVDRLFVGEAINKSCLKIFHVVNGVLIGPLGSQAESLEEDKIHDIIEGWLQRTLSFPPLNTWLSGEDMEDWFQLVLSCYPLRPTRGMRQFRPQRQITHVERRLLLELLRKQRLDYANSTINTLPVVQTLLSKFTVVVVGYCWTEFDQEDWEFVFDNTRRCIESTVVLIEEVTESVNETITGVPTSDIPEKLQYIVSGLDSATLKIATNALISFSLFCGLNGQETVDSQSENEYINPLRTDKWDAVKDKIVEGILRLLFSTGAAEAIAGSYSSTASSVIASTRLDDCHFWELVASSAVESSSHSREDAIISFGILGLSKGAVSSLYAILFSSKPVPYLQYAAYVILSSEPVADSAFITEDTFHLREEISMFLERSLPFDISELDLVHVFVAWSLLISPPLSPTKKKLIQHISRSSILDFMFRQIPLELCATSGKKDISRLPAEILEIAAAATRAITDNSLIFAVERLWPIRPDGMAYFAAAIYGLMITTLPAYVREWFNDVHDPNSSSAIESFTRTWCSPSLITMELSQIKKANLCNEYFSVSVSKSANEVVATYTEEETTMELVVRLPSSYSLRQVDFSCTGSFGITEVKQRKWLFSMMAFTRNQNGALAEAIRIWKKNIEREFEGIQQCMICLSVIHSESRSLPRLACRTCNGKFHSACISNHFKSSDVTICPLCNSLY